MEELIKALIEASPYAGFFALIYWLSNDDKNKMVKHIKEAYQSSMRYSAGVKELKQIIEGALSQEEGSD